MSGIKINTARKATWKIMDSTTVQGLFVFFGFGLETTISSNMVPYLLPAGARRPVAPELARVLLPAADPVLVVRPWPRQRFHATTIGAAMPKLEYVPTTIPTTKAKEKARKTCPPIKNKTRTVRNVRPLVKSVRERVWLMDLFTTSAKDSRRSRRLFSRMRSKITMVSFIEYPTRVSMAAITVREISKRKSDKNPIVINTS